MTGLYDLAVEANRAVDEAEERLQGLLTIRRSVLGMVDGVERAVLPSEILRPRAMLVVEDRLAEAGALATLADLIEGLAATGANLDRVLVFDPAQIHDPCKLADDLTRLVDDYKNGHTNGGADSAPADTEPAAPAGPPQDAEPPVSDSTPPDVVLSEPRTASYSVLNTRPGGLIQDRLELATQKPYSFCVHGRSWPEADDLISRGGRACDDCITQTDQARAIDDFVSENVPDAEGLSIANGEPTPLPEAESVDELAAGVSVHVEHADGTVTNHPVTVEHRLASDGDEEDAREAEAYVARKNAETAAGEPSSEAEAYIARKAAMLEKLGDTKIENAMRDIFELLQSRAECSAADMVPALGLTVNSANKQTVRNALKRLEDPERGFIERRGAQPRPGSPPSTIYGLVGGPPAPTLETFDMDPDLDLEGQIKAFVSFAQERDVPLTVARIALLLDEDLEVVESAVGGLLTDAEITLENGLLHLPDMGLIDDVIAELPAAPVEDLPPAPVEHAALAAAGLVDDEDDDDPDALWRNEEKTLGARVNDYVTRHGPADARQVSTMLAYGIDDVAGELRSLERAGLVARDRDGAYKGVVVV